MQRDPEKVYNNYNEICPPAGGYHIPFDLQNEQLLTSEQQLIVDTGIRLVKIGRAHV